MSKVCEFVSSVAEPLAEKMGLYLIDVEYVKKHEGYVLTIFLDKPNGISLDDLENFSRNIEPMLDENENMFNASYALNCSSPGLDRNLKTDIEFKLALGKEVVVKFYKPLKPYNKKELIGELKAFSNDDITISLGEKEASVSIPKNIISTITKNIKF